MIIFDRNPRSRSTGTRSQAKGAEHRRVRCSVARRGDGIVGRAGQSFLELYLKPPMPGRGKQRVSDAALLVGLDYHVEIAKHYYSVPHQLLRQEVEAAPPNG